MNKTTPCHDQRAQSLASSDDTSIDTERVRAKAESLHGGRVSHALVALIVKLERMIKSDIPVERRLELVRSIEPQVIQAGAGMPKPVAAARQPDDKGAVGQALEQRIYCLTAANLTLALEALDRSPLTFTEGAASDRWWLVTHLFGLLRRQIEFSVRWDRPWPPQVWKQLHDLRLYLIARTDIMIGTGGEGPGFAFDPDQEYKCLLLLGLIARLVRPEKRSELLFWALPLWAKESRLREPSAFESLFNFYLVDISRDEPLRLSMGTLQPGFNGWVLEPAEAFLAYVTRLDPQALTRPP